MSRESLKGQLLVANPAMPDTNFLRTIVFMLAHGDEGALGIVLNRPTALPVSDALTGWSELAADPPVVFSGGPVEPTAAICLAQAAPGSSTSSGAATTRPASGPGERWSAVLGLVGTFDLTGAAETDGVVVERLRVFSGYAGWGAGQLEAELAAGGWFVVAATVDDLLSPHPELLWRRVLKRQSDMISVLSSYPVDPSLN
jgi:putative transcriptional regulator